ncbi:MAG: divalent-cation tolerance protein CutA [Myxococcales bacterium]|nr:divalent-cation tolerance protein CutA [Myxococcales bacterium]MCB9705716.1 divalent-cation tolerance protein CutA [Myxococcales bacterium]
MLASAPAIRLVLMTCPPDQAEQLLLQLLRERLVGCGNVVSGVRSCYWWEGQICRETESLILMETAPDRLPALLERAEELHPYEVPKIVAIDPSACVPGYLEWLSAVTRPAPPSEA